MIIKNVLLSGTLVVLLGGQAVAQPGQPASGPTPEPAPKATPPAPPPAPAPPKPAPAPAKPVSKSPAVEEEEVVVITATRTPQKVEEAPSIISVVTREEILGLGYLSIGEALRNVVGIGINDNGHWPDTGIRGINDRTTYGDKILMLVDGHDMSWRQFLRNYHNPTWIDMQDIARIEVVRGPGSAVWGANALTGVVNIVPRSWANLNGAEFTYGANHRFSSQLASARVGKMLTPNLGVYGSVSYYYDNPDPLLAPIREYQLLSGLRMPDIGNSQNGINLTLKARYRWFQASFSKQRYDTGAPLSTFSVIGGENSRFITDRHIFYLSFQKTLFSGFDLSLRFDFDDYSFADGTVYDQNPGASTPGDPARGGPGRSLVEMRAVDRRYEWKAQAIYVPTPKLQGVAGVEGELLDLVRWYFPQVWTYEGLPTPTFNNLHIGTYLQAQYSPWRLLGLTAGVRMDYDQIYGFVATPRAGAVVRLPAGFYVKGLFGTAYKAPSFHDLYYYRKDAFYGNPKVRPENNYTGEGQLGYRSIPFEARVTGFYVYVKDLIGYGKKTKDAALDYADAFPAPQRPSGTKEYSQKTNLPKVTSVGMEAEVLARPLSWLHLSLNGTFRLPRDANGKQLPYDSQWTAGGSVTFFVRENVLASFRALGVGTKPVPAQAMTQVGFPTFTAEQDPTLSAPAYFLGTVVLSASNLFRTGLSLSLKLDNITNLEYWDAGREVLYPQRKFQAMMWASLAL